ncbi:hypothetical protein [Falsiroseomonas tokyonensis]|uniref:Heparinase n=1 Tax=Falsiroseomonas tokyonensis TaxID=430521 RepID=A0ABV7BR69_9PROT|nr:hypothetical protein [Falsiroseomonas tokyonensis]MBU8537041.1 hypothetical protein [Falsiroseomonas tokyonensis]
MRNLLHATDRDRLIAHLRGALLREVTLGGRRLMALAEGDGPESGSFCAVPANAQAAELLAQPDIRDADPAFADGLLDFVMAMAEAPIPCRRAAAGGIEMLRDDPRDFEILTPFHRFTGDLSAGMVRQQLRGQGGPPMLHTGNLVEFRLGRFRNGVDAEDTIRDFAISRRSGSVVLSHESRITGKAGFFRARTVEAGRLRYEYEITAGSPLLRLTVTFTAAAGQRVTRLRVSTALDQLGSGGLEMAEGRLGQQDGAWRDFGVPQAAGMTVWAEAGPVPHVAIGPAGWPAGGPTLHLRPQAPGQVMSARAIAARPGALHWVILRHGPAKLAPGEALVVREDRLLAAGTGAAEAARVMAAAGATGDQLAGLDLDPLPPNGASLNAVATQLLLAARDGYRLPLPAERMTALEGWFDRQLAALQAGQPGLADLAFAVLAVEARLRAGAQPPLASLVAALLARQTPSGGFRDGPPGAGGRPATLAGHAAALLAMARALPHLDPLLLAGPIGRAIAAVKPGPAELSDGGRLVRLEGLALDGATPAPLRDHAEAIGLLARAAGTVALAGEARPEALPAEVLAQAQALHRQAVALLRPLVRPRGTALEVVPSPLGGTAHPAAQAAVVMGLMAPDAAILRLPLPRQAVPA